MIQIPNFLSNDECNKLIKRIESDNTRSRVACDEKNQSTYDQQRTSSSSILWQELYIQKKIAEELNINIDRAEDLQGQKYESGQYFRLHHDYFEGYNYEYHCQKSGNRTHSFMIYLNDNYEGGETNFPLLNLSIKPEKGKAVWWYNIKDGELQQDTIHEGKDVISGTKYIVTSWWRERTHK